MILQFNEVKNMGRALSRDKRLRVGRKMPALLRRQPGQAYVPEADDVLRWVSEQPELLDYVFELLSRRGHVTYNPETGEWKGVDV